MISLCWTCSPEPEKEGQLYEMVAGAAQSDSIQGQTSPLNTPDRFMQDVAWQNMAQIAKLGKCEAGHFIPSAYEHARP